MVMISEIYRTIQGESTLTGLPTIFIRTFGCNLRCTWCDSAYAVNPNWKDAPEVLQGKQPWFQMTPGEVVGKINTMGKPPFRICLTGGEPLIQKDIYDLLGLLLPISSIISIETDGEILLDRIYDLKVIGNLEGMLHQSGIKLKVIMDVKCPGSGMEAKVAYDNVLLLSPQDEIKFAIKDKVDYEFAKNWIPYIRKHQPEVEILFSPIVGYNGLQPSDLAEWILEDGLDVRINLQIHKLVWPEKVRGV